MSHAVNEWQTAASRPCSAAARFVPIHDWVNRRLNCQFSLLMNQWEQQSSSITGDIHQFFLNRIVLSVIITCVNQSIDFFLFLTDFFLPLLCLPLQFSVPGDSTEAHTESASGALTSIRNTILNKYNSYYLDFNEQGRGLTGLTHNNKLYFVKRAQVCRGRLRSGGKQTVFYM